MINQQLAQRLRQAFLNVGYLTDPVLAAIGADGQAGLGRNVTIAAAANLGNDALSDLIRLWILQQGVEETRLAAVLPVAELVGAGILARSGGQIRALVDVRPYGCASDGASSDGAPGWLMSDLLDTLDGRTAQPRPDFVLGASPASTTLAQMTIRRQVASALDLGTGCGVQSLHLSRHAGRVVATDLNPRALQHAAWTASLSGFDVDLRLGSLYEPVAGQRFDLIVTNPPYVMSPPTVDGQRLVYREANWCGDGLVEAVVRGAVDHLNPGGTLQVLGNWAVVDEDWQARLANWIPDGCDALIMERERLSKFEYIEMWLADAGLLGSDAWARRYQEWLAYFESMGIQEVGLGWIEMQRHADTPNPQLRRKADVRVQAWPWAVVQPVGPAFAAAQEGRRLAQTSDDELLAGVWQLADDVIQETSGRPGEADPAHVVLRSQTGFKRALEVSTALGGVLGACDGTLPLGGIISAVSGILDANEDAVRAEVLPGVREALRYAMLRSCRSC